jgi:uncharacterized membrane protein YbaN (DUF454 family)
MKQGSMFFFEKKNQKTFISWWYPRKVAGPFLKRWGLDRGSGAGIKVFLLLFLQKKKKFLFRFRCAAQTLTLPTRGIGRTLSCAA